MFVVHTIFSLVDYRHVIVALFGQHACSEERSGEINEVRIILCISLFRGRFPFVTRQPFRLLNCADVSPFLCTDFIPTLLWLCTFVRTLHNRYIFGMLRPLQASAEETETECCTWYKTKTRLSLHQLISSLTLRAEPLLLTPWQETKHMYREKRLCLQDDRASYHQIKPVWTP